jgi:ABC-2 type transport system ATP-binding protein
MGVRNADIEGTLSRVGLPGTSSQPVSQFSLGMRQRLGIARAIIHRPQLLLLDEPINGLDPMGIRDMRELFTSLSRDDGMTLMISSHILGEIGHIADTIGVIVDGTVVKEVAMDSIKESHPEGLEDYFFAVMKGREAQ